MVHSSEDQLWLQYFSFFLFSHHKEDTQMDFAILTRLAPLAWD
jgi:hypothetical protein